MKKVLIIMFLSISLVLTGCNKKMNTYEELTYDEFLKKIENKESFPLVVGSSECSHCADYKITMEKLIKEYQIKVYFIDVLKIKDNYDEFLTYVNFGGSTPTTVFIVDGEEKTVYDRIVGALSYSKVVSKFKSAGYIKED